ncbi:hypothetical protein [Rhizobium aethiopicum]|uniref:hypothetical protein n=1 Tax=Rhizobium aethiopicum TaxID=1138170 RepID=UPI0011311DFE|nr:hypothetical protein [Rhizobium aethiopicum]
MAAELRVTMLFALRLEVKPTAMSSRAAGLFNELPIGFADLTRKILDRALTDGDYTTISSISAAIGTLLTAIGLAYAALQIRWSKQATREAEALQAYRNYLERCVQYPELSSGDNVQEPCVEWRKGRVYDAWTLTMSAIFGSSRILITTCDEILMNVSDAE